MNEGTPSPAGQQPLVTKPIEQVRVGDRVAGRNPLREQAELFEPDPQTWQKIGLRMTKESGEDLWIELLRPQTWVEEEGATPGSTVFVELFEMGAVGDAEVLVVESCPPIAAGEGTVVTGTFKHLTDDSPKLVRLRLEDQHELTCVTDTHAYWSEDRADFIEAGKLQVGETVDTECGPRRLVAIDPIEHEGFLYNLETTEHVYRVGTLGTLVHNNCLIPGKLTRAESDALREAARDLWQSRTGRRAIWDEMDIHHRSPLEWAHKFPKANPNRVANLVGIHRNHHPALNRGWSDFKTRLNGRDSTAAEVMRNALEIDERFGQIVIFLP